MLHGGADRNGCRGRLACALLHKKRRNGDAMRDHDADCPMSRLPTLAGSCSCTWEETDDELSRLRGEGHQMRTMLGAIKAWCSRNGHTYAERLAMSGLGELGDEVVTETKVQAP
jgi:hypothetical protein